MLAVAARLISWQSVVLDIFDSFKEFDCGVGIESVTTVSDFAGSEDSMGASRPPAPKDKPPGYKTP